MVDGLGRLVRIDEPDKVTNNLGAIASPVQPTSYTYDVFGNLTTVIQDGQTRTFTYDSLSRLRSAINPESGTVNYQYDDNGNLVVKTDARLVSAHYSYDALNRLTRRWFNGSNSTNAATHNGPGLPAGVGASDEAVYMYDVTGILNSKGRLTSVSSSASTQSYNAYDALGRATNVTQTMGSQSYTLNYVYSLAGQVKSITYPSGHEVAYAYDNAGRATSFTGNLGGASRNYSTEATYSPTGGMIKEKFGTDTALYNNSLYNSRGQLAEIRVGSSNTDPTSWNRGAIINHYSNSCWGVCENAAMTDNNGNLKKQDVYIPENDQISSHKMWTQQFDYDKLNRLNWVKELNDGGATLWQQEYEYDRYGNRTIHQANTWGAGINKKDFTPNVDNKNRLGVPSNQSGRMDYDAAGNLVNDTYTSYGRTDGIPTRLYDAENRLTTAKDGNLQVVSGYSYNADGQRVRRNVGAVETWQIYGLSGELLAEYAANAASVSPQKEYGYRNGQLLITATIESGLAANAPPSPGGADAGSAGILPAMSAQREPGLSPTSGSPTGQPGWGGTVAEGVGRSLIFTKLLAWNTTPSLKGGLLPFSGSDVSGNPGFDFFAVPVPQAGSSKIVFTSNRDGNAEIYSMNADGSGLTRLTINDFNDDRPRWSPDGTKILFQSDRDNPETGNADVYVMNANGTSQTRLTYDAADDSAAVWSPDSAKIVFQSLRNGQYYQVYVMNADGTNQLNKSNGIAADYQPSWSPNGAQIAFASDRDQAGFSSIYVMNANGSSQTRLTFSALGLRDEQPVWSPDGTKLAFVSTRESVVETWRETDDDGIVLTRSPLRTNKEVYVMNADGTNQIRLTNTLENDDLPAWSPDGTRLVFRSDRGRQCCDPVAQVWTMNADGSSQVNLSNNQLGDFGPNWQGGSIPPPTPTPTPTPTATIQSLVADQLGTPRMVFDQTGALGNVKGTTTYRTPLN
jgi:YD repeat-containing protein